MRPRRGDMVHFRSICGACNKVGRRHYSLVVDDRYLISKLPEFKKRLNTYAGERMISLWWDHSPSILELYKLKLDGLLSVLPTFVGRRERHGYEDTYLMLLTDDHVFLNGPSRGILPLTIDEISNDNVALVASRMNLTHFNYLDLTTLPTVALA